MRVKVVHAGYDLHTVEDALRAAGLVSEGATYEPGYPIYGTIDPDKLEALRAVPGVVDVQVLDN